jgi:hypothetical protein
MKYMMVATWQPRQRAGGEVDEGGHRMGDSSL